MFLRSRALFLFLASCFLLPAFAEATPQIIYYNLKDTIHGGTVEILNRIFDKAKKENAEAIFIQMDTPGGLLDSTEDIVKLLLNSENSESFVESFRRLFGEEIFYCVRVMELEASHLYQDRAFFSRLAEKSDYTHSV